MHVIAVDLGAETGRVMRADFDGERLTLNEVNRFSNTAVRVRDTLYWDVLRQWRHIAEGIAGASGAAAVGVDTWGVDWALLDRDGKLLANPVHYRDKRTEGMFEWVFERMPRREIFARTGIQFMQINGLFQIASLVRANSPLLGAAATFLTIADLFNYWLSGSKTCEFSHATTQQMFNPTLNDWDHELIAACDLPVEIFPPIVQPGTRIGDYEGIPVIAPACHDTGSAVVAVPTTTKNYAYLSSGTWSLLGLEIPTPIINDAVYNANLTNEGGVYGTYRLLKNISGMWLAQQCRAAWAAAGQQYEYAELVALAGTAPPFQAFIDVDDPAFLAPPDMPAAIRAFCGRSGQASPENIGAIMRTIYESLALKYRYVLEMLINVSGQQVDTLHIIGGGSQNALLCQMTADATGRVVIAGPAEGTAIGNAVVQLIALGELRDIAQAREMLRRTMPTVTYEPRQTAAWDAQYERFKGVLTTV